MAAVGTACPAVAEQTRARQPDASGFVERDGVRVFWERYGDGEPTILLMPTWSIFPSRHWKFQIPYLARSFRVVTLDGRGNGRSDRPTDPAAYADTEYVADAAAVLDTVGCEAAVVAGLSMGAGYALRAAVDLPDRVLGLILIGAAIGGRDRPEGTPDVPDDADFEGPSDPEADGGWGRYNAHFWRQAWPAFADWFVGTRIFSDPHSTKLIEDGLGWALATDPEGMVASRRGSYLRRPPEWPIPPSTEGRGLAFARRVRCPALLIHGRHDQIIGLENPRRVATALGGRLLEIEGVGHAPNLREPVRVNHAIRDFVRDLPGGAA
jgi:pimeloyl-ACP methyl ester carboxylesterase